MLLNKDTFDAVRTDTYALFIDDLGLYYHYAKALLNNFIREVDGVDTSDVFSEEKRLNYLLSVIRETHTTRTRIISENAKSVLDHQGLDSEELVASFRAGKVYIEGHTQTGAVKECPLPIKSIVSSRVSSTQEALVPESDLNRIDGELSNYASSDLVASIVGGASTSQSVLASGSDRLSLKSYIENFNDTKPVRLEADVEVVTQTDTGTVRSAFKINSVLDNSDVELGGFLLRAVAESSSSVFSWVASRRQVRLPFLSIGASGPMFEYPLSTSIIDNSLLLRPGMCLENNMSVVVSSVLGERVTLSTPVSIYGTLPFVYKACTLWGSYLPLLKDISVVGNTDEQRVNSLLAQAKKRAKSCHSLMKSIPTSVNKKRFDIRSAHYAVSADYAYNLLERGELIEYHRITEQQANRGSIMAIAASHIRAGTRL